MCYNYETLVKRKVKRSIRQQGLEETMAELTEAEKKAIEDDKLPTVDASPGGEEAPETEPGPAYPGQESQVIPITTKEREFYYFGFLPGWAKTFNDHRKNFNARSDSIRIKPTWRGAWSKAQRCLVCATGFYEDDKVNKMRYFFSVKGKDEVFFAGIFNHWKDPSTGDIAKTFAIITSEPNELVAEIHPRMPVILNDAAAKLWLADDATEEEVFNLLVPYSSELMQKKEAPKPPRKKKGEDQISLGF